MQQINHELFEKHKDGKLIGIEMHPSKDPHIDLPLRCKEIFSITLDEANRVDITCSINPNKQHKCFLTYGEKVFLVIQVLYFTQTKKFVEI